MAKQTSTVRRLFTHRAIPAVLLLFSVLSLFFIIDHPKSAFATPSDTINFQARLQSASGAIVPDGTYNVEFKLYNASTGGTAVWTEDYLDTNGQGLTTVNGYLTANLGSITSFPSTIDWSQQMYLTMNIGGTGSSVQPTNISMSGWDGEMNPRLALTASPYAFQAQTAAQAGELSTTSGSNTATLSIQAPSANETFEIQDQGTAGTYYLLTTAQAVNNYVALQGGSPTQQTGQIDISGAVTAGSIKTSTIDTASAGTIAIGGTNATAISLGNTTSNIATTINGTVLVKPTTGHDSTTAFQVQNSNGASLLTADTTDSSVIIQGSSTGSSTPLKVLDGTGTTALSVTTPTVLINDNLISSTPTGTLKDSATYSSGNYVQLNPNTGGTDGELEYTPTVSGSSIDAKFNFWSGGGTGADASYFYAWNTSTPTSEDQSDGGYIIAYDEYEGQIQLLWNGTSLATASVSGIANSAWHSAEIVKNGNAFSIYMDGALKLSYTDTTRTLSGTKFGLGGRDGGLTDAHRVTNFVLTNGASSADTTAVNGNATVSGSTTSGSVYTPTLDTASATGLTIGGTNATGVSVGNATSGTTVTVQGGSGTSAVSVQAASGGTINLGTSNANVITVGNTSSTNALTLQGEGINDTITGSATGPTDIIKSSTNYINAFQIQNSAGGDVLNVDTSDTYVGINTSAPVATLDVAAASPAFTYGFENATLSPLSTTTGSNWYLTSSAPVYAGSYDARGQGSGSTGQSYSMTLTETLNSAGTVSFWYNCSWTTGTTFTFYVDSTANTVSNGSNNGCAAVSNSTTWTQASYSVGSGSHTFTWTYTYGSSSLEGTSNFNIDNIAVTNVGSATAAVFTGGGVGIGATAPTSTLDVVGTGIFESSTNSTTAFQVQNASAINLLNVDTTNSAIGLGSLPNQQAGYTTIGGTTNGGGQGGIEIQKMTTGAAGTLSSISVYFTSSDSGATNNGHPNTAFQVAIYADNAGAPGAKIANSIGDSNTVTAGAWNTVSFPAGTSLSASTSYWLAVEENGSGNSADNTVTNNAGISYKFWNPGASVNSTTVAYNAWPSTFTGGPAANFSTTTQDISIYANVTGTSANYAITSDQNGHIGIGTGSASSLYQMQVNAPTSNAYALAIQGQTSVNAALYQGFSVNNGNFTDFNVDTIARRAEINGWNGATNASAALSVYGYSTDNVLNLLNSNGSNILMTVGSSGAATFENSSDSSAAFQIQNHNGYSILNANTSTGAVTFGNVTTNSGQGVAGSLVLADGTADGYGVTISSATQANNVAVSIPADTHTTDTLCLQTLANCGGATAKTATKVVAMGTATGCTGTSPVASASTAGADYVSTSCTAADTTIQAAINALPTNGGMVYIEDGTYIISSSITIPSNVTLEGAGANTILKLKDSSSGLSGGMMYTNSLTTNDLIENLTIDGNKANQSSGSNMGLVLNNGTPGAQVDHVLIQNIYSPGGGGGLYITSGQDTVTNTTVTGSTYYGVYDIDTTTHTVSNTTASSNTQAGFNLSSQHSSYSNDSAISNGWMGFRDTGGPANVFTGDVADSNSAYGFYIGANDSITGSASRNNGSDGIYVAGSNTNISGNTIYNNQGAGVDAYADNYGTIANNTISLYTGAGETGINTMGTNWTITGNFITSNHSGSYGIFISSAVWSLNDYISGNTFIGSFTSQITDNGNDTSYSGQEIIGNATAGTGDLAFVQGSGAIDLGGTSTGTSTVSITGGISTSQLGTIQCAFSACTASYTGASGSTTWTYEVTALDGSGETLPSSAVQATTTGATPLTSSNYTTFNFPFLPGAVKYNVYRTVGTTTGLVTTITASTLASTCSATGSSVSLSYSNGISFKDTGCTAGASVPTVNTTGGATFVGQTTVKSAANNAAAFQIQNSSGQNLLNVDTSSNNINIGATGSLAVSSIVNIATSTGASQTVHIGDTSGETSTVTVGSTGSTSATTVQGGSGGISINAGTGSSNAITIGNTGNTGTAAITLRASGISDTINGSTQSETIMTTTNSTTAFQIQDSNSSSVLTANTTNDSVNTQNFNVGSSANLGGAGRLYSDGFESGNSDQWNYGATSTGTSTGIIVTSPVHEGKYAVQFNQTGSGHAYVATAFNNSSLTTASRLYVNLSSVSASTGMNLMFNQDWNDTNEQDIYLNGSRDLCEWNGAGSGTGICSSTVLNTGTWYEVELDATIGSSGSWTVYLNGVNVLSRTGINTGSNPLTQLFVGDFYSDVAAYTIDDVSVDTVSTGTSADLNVADSLHVSGTSSFGNGVLIQPAAGTYTALDVLDAAGYTQLSVDTMDDCVNIGGANCNTDQGALSAVNSNNNASGLYGKDDGTGASGVAGFSNGAGSNGVYGEDDQSSGYGVQGYSSAGTGVQGSSSTDTGVAGYSTSWTGVFGSSSSGNGVWGTSATGNSGYFQGGSSNTNATLLAQQNGSSTASLIQAEDSSNNPLFAVGSTGATTITDAATITSSNAALSVVANNVTSGSAASITGATTLSTNGGSIGDQIINVGRSLTANVSGSSNAVISDAGGYFPNGIYANSPGTNTDIIQPHKVGDLIVLSVFIASSAIKVNSISGGSATGWAAAKAVQDATNGADYEVWTATATSTSSAAFTITYSGTDNYFNGFAIDDLTTTVSSPTWSVVTSNNQHNTSNVNMTYPSLTPTGVNEAYWGVAFPGSSGYAVASSSAGFTMTNQALGDGGVGGESQTALDPSLTNGTPYQPIGTQAPADQSFTIGMIVKAVSSSGSESVTSPVASFSDNCTTTTGTCVDSSNVLQLQQQFSGASGTVLSIQDAGTGDTLDLKNGSGTIMDDFTSSGNLQISGALTGSIVTSSVSFSGVNVTTINGTGLAYNLSATVGNVSGATEYQNIIGLPQVAGTVAYIMSSLTKTTGTTSESEVVEINQQAMSTLTLTSATTIHDDYTVMYDGYQWHIVGFGPTSSSTSQQTYESADYAEWIDYSGDTAPQPGDVLTVGDSYTSVKDSSTPYDNHVIGVVSTDPYNVGSANDGHSVVMALSGRVPVKVDLENGPIEPGDPLTSSSTPGVAMKATEGGQIIGTALEAYDGTQSSNEINVQLHPGYDDPNPGTIQGDANISGGLYVGGNMQIEGNLIVAGTTTTQYLNVSGNANLAVLSVAGGINASSVTVTGEVGAATLNVSGSANFGGDVTIGSGSTSESTPHLLVLDSESNSGTDPTEVNGAMFYSVATGTFRCGIGGAWVNCIAGNQSWAVDGLSSSGTSTSSMYANYPGSYSSISFTKASSSTKLLIHIDVDPYLSSGTSGVMGVDVQIAGADYACGQGVFNSASVHSDVSCTAVVTGIAAGAQSAQIRWAILSGSGTTPTINTGSAWEDISVQETN